MQTYRNRLNKEQPGRYLEELQKYFDPSKADDYRDIHAALVRTDFRSFVTTNYDDSLRCAGTLLKPPPIRPDAVRSFPVDRLRPSDLRDRWIIHVHGRAYDSTGKCCLDKIVLTKKDFDSAYKRLDLIQTLGGLLLDLSVVFIGFSAKDGALSRVMKKHTVPFLAGLGKHETPPGPSAYGVRYYVFRPVAFAPVSDETEREGQPVVTWRYDSGEVQREERTALGWFTVDGGDLHKSVRPILYRWQESDSRHKNLTVLMQFLQNSAPYDAPAERGQ